MFLPRNLETSILNAFCDFDVVYLNGARQCGKSTLAYMLQKKVSADFVTLDDYSTLMRAKNDPLSFLKQSPNKMLIIDEIQLAPELFRPLKHVIDEQRITGTRSQFLLTGSINILNIPTLSEALVGRMAVKTLYPFSVSEVLSKNAPTFDDLFDLKIQNFKFEKMDWREMIQKATYPEMIKNKNINRYQWFDHYITTLLQRDVRSLANIEKILEMPKLLRILSTRVGGLSNDTNVAVDASLNLSTYRRYKTLLESVFLITYIEAWHTSLKKRLIKSPKLYFTDTALVSHLLKIKLEDLESSHPLYGHLFENFVASELIKSLDPSRFKIFHYRDSNNVEVDFMIENQKGEVIGLEVKACVQLSRHDVKNLKIVQGSCPFKFGFVLHSGHDFYPICENIYALPISFFQGM